MSIIEEQIKRTQELLAGCSKIHIIGGGGVGMSALGMLALDMGYSVSASDKNAGVYLEKLNKSGAKTWVGSAPENIEPDCAVFYSTAISPQDPERLWAKENCLCELSRHSLLGFITSKYYTVAVSGTHGKTTTTAWVGWLLEKAGMDPTVFSGGTMKNWNANLKKGNGLYNGEPLLVLEADESDESFLYINAKDVIITNMELDHVDHYAKTSDVEDKFNEFIQKGHAGGAAVASMELLESKFGMFFPNLAANALKTRLDKGLSFQELNDILSE